MADDISTRSPSSKSSGGQRGGQRTHGATCGLAENGYSALPLAYRSWLTMRRRCSDPKAGDFDRYGGRGIQVHQPWAASYEAFFACLGDCPSGHTLDRINPNGHYEPGNVRWASAKEQARNTRNTPRILIGDRVMPVIEACEVLGFNPGSIRSLSYRLGRPAEEILAEFISGKRKRRRTRRCRSA